MRKSLLFALTALAACSKPSAPAHLAAAAGPAVQLTSADDLEHWMTEAGFPFRTLEKGKRYTVPFDGKNVGSVLVVVERGAEVTTLMAKFFTLPEMPAPFLRALLNLNFKLAETKMVLTDAGDLFAAYDISNRLLDKKELLDGVQNVARVIDAYTPQLYSLAQKQAGGGQPAPTMPPPPQGAPVAPPMVKK